MTIVINMTTKKSVDINNVPQLILENELTHKEDRALLL